MCLGAISVLDEAWDDEGVRVGRLSDGRTVPLSFVPDAVAGEILLLHLGIPVEVLAPDVAQTALALRSPSLANLNENGATS
jgi:hydrogenase maturation factor